MLCVCSLLFRVEGLGIRDFWLRDREDSACLKFRHQDEKVLNHKQLVHSGLGRQLRQEGRPSELGGLPLKDSRKKVSVL